MSTSVSTPGVIHYDVIVVGGSLGGVAATIAAAEADLSVCLLEESEWLGGQYSSQGVNKPDENRYIEDVGSTSRYRDFRHSVRAYYRENYRLSQNGSAQPAFNPGGAYPGFAVEPRLAHSVLLKTLERSPNAHVRLKCTVTRALTDAHGVTGLEVTDFAGNVSTYAAKFYLDGTDLGDFIALAGVEHRLGAEAKSETGEPNAPPTARPEWIQPITVTMALERRPAGENHTITRPANYEALKSAQNYTIVDGYIDSMFNAGSDMWSYRRFIDASNFADPTFPMDLSILNTGSNDYQGGTLPTGDKAKDAAVVEAARQATLGFLYWLQTECPRSDSKKAGYPELKPRGDVFGTTDGTAAAPYIRESRRIEALGTVHEQDVDQDHNPGPRAKPFSDSCGIGFYGGLDVHGLQVVDMPQVFIYIRPFQIPVGSLIPKRVTNVLPACKNIGVSHIANGAYRLHPVEWNIGESAALLAAYCIEHGVTPQQMHSDLASTREYQRTLLAVGVPLFWWSDVTIADPDLFEAANLLGLAGLMTGFEDMSFRAAQPLDSDARADIAVAVDRTLNWPAPGSSSDDLTRGVAAKWLVRELGLVSSVTVATSNKVSGKTQ